MPQKLSISIYMSIYLSIYISSIHVNISIYCFYSSIDLIHLDLLESSLTKLQHLENRANNIIRNSLSKAFIDLKIPNIRSTRIYNASMTVFKSLHQISCEPFNYFLC